MSLEFLEAVSEQMPATGGNKLGGLPITGHLGLPSLLVREAIQNSWDARDDDRGDAPVHFRIDGWDLDTDRLRQLQSLMPVSGLQGFQRQTDAETARGVLHPATALDRPTVRILVISDRNTVGLCGPTRSGRQWDPVRGGKPLVRGQQRFANFIRNIGRATADIGDGDGGAYGLGKGALWMASECGTVLVHTRTTDDAGEPVERFIGTVHGEHFYSDGNEFTGRHFIGRRHTDGVIEPLTGADAQHAAKLLPLPSYSIGGRDVDGTSIVIVAPKLSLEWRIEMERLRDAIRWNAWPKRVPGVRGVSVGPDIEVHMAWNNNAVEVPLPLDDPEIKPYAQVLLDCVRERNSGESQRDFVAECHRPKKVLGATKFRTGGKPDDNVFHVTLSAEELQSSGSDPKNGDIDEEPAVDFKTPWGQMALIRREPLLLVRYQRIGGSDEAATEVGVFLSADDHDVEEALTRAEPPAHDDWIHKIVPKDGPNDHRRTFAKRTGEEIKRAVKELIASHRVSGAGERGGGEQALSRRLSQGLLGGLGGKTSPTPKKTGTGTGTARSTPRADLSSARSYRAGADTVHEIDVALTGLGKVEQPVRLTCSASAFDNDGKLPFGEKVAYSWFNPDGTELADGASVALDASDDTRVTLALRVTGDLRLRPKVEVRRTDGI